jgi:hypothetical protein
VAVLRCHQNVAELVRAVLFHPRTAHSGKRGYVSNYFINYY